MKTINRKFKALLITLSIALVVALVAVAFSFTQTSKKHGELREKENNIAQLKIQLDNYSKIMKADEELLLGGSKDSAMRIYHKLLPELDGPTAYIVRRRIEMVLKSEPYRTQKIEMGKNTVEISRLRKTVDSLIAQNQMLRKNQENAALTFRTDTLQISETKPATKPEEKQNVQVISFKNENGNTIHYLGEVANGKAHGGGVGIWSTGSIYRGDWRDNKRHGTGEFEWSDGVKYVGQYRGDKRHGEGTYNWPSGERYEGGWKNDIREGYGVLYDQDGNIKFKGTWKNDKPVKEP